MRASLYLLLLLLHGSSSMGCANFVGTRVPQVQGEAARCIIQTAMGEKKDPRTGALHWLVRESDLQGAEAFYAFDAHGRDRQPPGPKFLYDPLYWQTLHMKDVQPAQTKRLHSTTITAPVAQLVQTEDAVELLFLPLHAISDDDSEDDIITHTPPLQIADLLYREGPGSRECQFSQPLGQVRIALSNDGRGVCVEEQLPHLRRLTLADLGGPISAHLNRFAYDLHLERRYGQAARWWERALSYQPADNEMRYNHACALARSKQADAAMRELKYIMAREPQRFSALLQQDTDFDVLRERPDFQAILVK